jgi:hypothetical protein
VTSARKMVSRARFVLVAILGSAVTLVGVAMLVLPGPAIVVIPLGLGILATQFVWARRWLVSLGLKRAAGAESSSPELPQEPDGGQAGAR